MNDFAGSLIEGRGRVPGSPAGTPAGRRLGRSFHAIRGRDAGSFRAHRVPGGERYGQVLGLCPIAASCIAVDVAMRWSADPDVREITPLVSERGTEIPLDPQNVYDYLPGAALAFKSLREQNIQLRLALSVRCVLIAALCGRAGSGLCA